MKYTGNGKVRPFNLHLLKRAAAPTGYGNLFDNKAITYTVLSSLEKIDRIYAVSGLFGLWLMIISQFSVVIVCNSFIVHSSSSSACSHILCSF